MSSGIFNSREDEYTNAQALFKAMDFDKNRFVCWEEREARSDINVDVIKLLNHGKYKTTWKGVELMKDALDLVILQSLIYSERPVTIFEVGTYSGGSALWLADIARSFDIQCHVYSIDISFECLHEKAKSNKDITFLLADASKDMEKALPAEKLKEMPHPWFITEDCHVPLEDSVGYLEKFMIPGDYLLVEDTHPSINRLIGQGLYTPGFDEAGFAKYNILKAFVEARPGKFMVDQHYTDFFGYNASTSMNSYLKRV